MTASKEGQHVTSKKEIFIVVLKGQRRSPPAPVQYSIVEAIRSAEYPAKSVPVPMPCIPSASLALLLTKFTFMGQILTSFCQSFSGFSLGGGWKGVTLIHPMSTPLEPKPIYRNFFKGDRCELFLPLETRACRIPSISRRHSVIRRTHLSQVIPVILKTTSVRPPPPPSSSSISSSSILETVPEVL